MYRVQEETSANCDSGSTQTPLTLPADPHVQLVGGGDDGEGIRIHQLEAEEFEDEYYDDQASTTAQGDGVPGKSPTRLGHARVPSLE